jgi:anti-sigma factor RsiW
VRAQALLSRASLEVGLESQANQDLIAFQLAQAIGPGLKLPDLGPQRFRFVRAQLLRAGEEPLAQLLYLGTSGAPLALYAKQGEGAATPSFKSYGAIGSVAWAKDGITYLLAGEADASRLMQLAETIRKQLDAPPDAAQSADRPYSPLPHPLTQPAPGQ